MERRLGRRLHHRRNVNFQVAGGTILDLGVAMQGYFDLMLGQLTDWRTNARNIYGARGFLAPPRTDGEHGHLLHFQTSWPDQCWTGAADWLLYPLLEHYQVTGDQAFLKDGLGQALMELAQQASTSSGSMARARSPKGPGPVWTTSTSPTTASTGTAPGRCTRSTPRTGPTS
ncbi:hypothetical protein [Streptomyces sp. NPDC057253]|uniref:glycosyl hydrolase family 95 catalytic domain-containing protein n=1 Tax=Streptomyces sp. NPDC057253 TaxID=3346069 RepID=UPI0036293282